MVSQAEFSEDDDWRPLAGWFAVKPRQATLPILGFAALRDKSIRWDSVSAIYTIQDLVNGKVIVTHIHNLRPFNYDEERTDPLTVAQQNAQEFVVNLML